MSVIISSRFSLSEFSGLNGQPLTHTRIGYQNLITEDNLSGTSGESDHPLSNIALDQTYETYKPASSNATIVVDTGTGSDVNYFGLAGRGMSAIKLEYSFNNSSWSTAVQTNDGSDVVTMGLFETITARYWRFTLSGSNQEVISIYLGKTLDMERPIYGGHSPLNLSRTTAFRPSMSEGGQWLGRTIQRRGFSTSFDFNNLTAEWYRSYFDDFVEHARTKPFFIAWRPQDYRNEVGYVWSNQDIQPSNTGTRDLMSVNFSVEGYDVEG